MRMYGTIDVLSFDDKEYSKALRKRLEKAFREAASEFVRAAVPLIPVETGMARGSFLNIGRLLKILIPITPTRFNQQYYIANRISLPKTPEQGALLSTPNNELFKWDGNKFKFTFESRVFHLTLEDVFGVRSPSAPWRAFETGRDAFIAHIKSLKGLFPDIKQFMSKATITFGRGTVTKSPRISLRKQATVNG